MTKFFIFQMANFDIPAIIGIVLGLLGSIVAGYSTWRSSQANAKVSETTAVLNSWKEFAQAQEVQSKTRALERIAQNATQDSRIEKLETKLELALLQFNECEKKHAKLEGKFEGLGIIQQTQSFKLSEQGVVQEVQGNRQDVQETRQNEQEERQNLIEHKSVETLEAVIKTKSEDC